MAASGSPSRACRPTSPTCPPAAGSPRAARSRVERCSTEEPDLDTVGPQHDSRCWVQMRTCPTRTADLRDAPLVRRAVRRLRCRRMLRRSRRRRRATAEADRWSRCATSSSTSPAGGQTVRAVDGVSLDIHPGRDAGPGRRVRLRQVHPGPGGHPAASGHRGLHLLRGQDLAALHGEELPRCAARADDLPGPLRLAQPAHDRRQHHRRAAAPTSGSPRAGARRAGAGGDAHLRAQPQLQQPLPARVQRRPAAAHRHRPRADPAAQLHRRRRADLGARRVDPGADHQPARGAAGRLQPHLPVHRPRPLGGAPHQRPGRGDVPRHDRRGGRQPRAVRQPAPPLHHGAARSRSRSPTRWSSASASRSSSRARCPRRSTRPAPAASTPAARSRSRSARRCAPTSSTTATDTSPPATSPASCRDRWREGRRGEHRAAAHRDRRRARRHRTATGRSPSPRSECRGTWRAAGRCTAT